MASAARWDRPESCTVSLPWVWPDFLNREETDHVSEPTVSSARDRLRPGGGPAADPAALPGTLGLSESATAPLHRLHPARFACRRGDARRQDHPCRGIARRTEKGDRRNGLLHGP